MTVKNLQDFPFTKLQKRAEEFRLSDREQRLAILERIKSMLVENIDTLSEALKKDLGKHEVESLLTEISTCTHEVNFFKKNLKGFMKRKKVASPMSLKGSSNSIVYDPKGLVLVLAPWNYPLNLAIMPCIAAIAAGNIVCLKASEFTDNLRKTLYQLIQDYDLQDYIYCIEGDHQVAADLCDLPFDHIFFTGSTEVGAKVMAAAAKNLCPVTLELGGKSPCIVDRSANLKTAAERIAWGKFTNCGQTCVAPDYLIVHEDVKEDLVKQIKSCLENFYGEDSMNIKENRDYGRIIHKRHWQRLLDLYQDALAASATSLHGGHYDQDERFFSPTIIDNVSFDSKIMQEEIFGPILPILTFKNEEEIHSIIKKNPNPLAMYFFMDDSSLERRLAKSLPSGGLCVNTVTTHLANPYLPFGGTKQSGFGAYHGEFGFKTFSHERAYHSMPHLSGLNLLLPPYNETFMKYFNKARSFLVNL